ncbi:hypothetical protein N5923_06605 [Erwiniaceae bacterium BAC15a-03b]|uniref:Topoisomerase II n=1 Tax=Winslowiella arboricola TaxID=2978220 RepID=A0A9J6PIH7_9GAMM|nr:hypothetical protein [Winslowiella arboricola]MCU5772858.1 hypothetical protein [Winslowiella arboricola]MCU5777162.1 hypothetical protein [Winslowiella arboricola]
MNNPTIIPSIIALLVLSLIALLLVKKGKIKRRVAVLIVIAPLLAGHIIWLNWIYPQQQQAAKIAAAQQQLATTPTYRVIKQQQPALYKQLNDELLTAVRQGTPTARAIGQLRPLLADLLNQRIGRAEDNSIISYMQLSVRQMQSLRQQSGELCFKFLFPQISGGVNTEEVLPPALQQQDLQQMEALLKASNGPDKPIDLAESRRSLQVIVRSLYAKWGAELQLLNAPTDSRVDQTHMCDMTIDLYQAILALPTKQSANVLRMMLSANAG